MNLAGVTKPSGKDVFSQWWEIKHENRRAHNTSFPKLEKWTSLHRSRIYSYHVKNPSNFSSATALGRDRAFVIQRSSMMEWYQHLPANQHKNMNTRAAHYRVTIRSTILQRNWIITLPYRSNPTSLFSGTKNKAMKPVRKVTKWPMNDQFTNYFKSSKTPRSSTSNKSRKSIQKPPSYLATQNRHTPFNQAQELDQIGDDGRGHARTHPCVCSHARLPACSLSLSPNMQST